MPDPGEFEMHLQSIAQEIASVEGVTSVAPDGDRAFIVETIEGDLSAFKPHLKPILQDHFEFARISSLDPL